MGRVTRFIGSALVLIALAGSSARAAGEPDPNGETLEQSLCRLIDAAAATHRLAPPFLTRLIWQESSFRPGVVSRAGAQGVAQFMPGTARERGLADPFDPEQAIPAAAALLDDLRKQFGNLGLAAAAYNAGPARVSAFLAGRGGLPFETRDYVVKVTGRSAEDWAADRRDERPATPPPSPAPGPAAEQACLQVTAELKKGGGLDLSPIAEGARAPWGVQLAGAFSKAAALAAFARSRAQIASVVGDRQPMILGGRLRSRGLQTFYRIRLPAQTRGEADTLCARIRSARGACVVLRT